MVIGGQLVWRWMSVAGEERDLGVEVLKAPGISLFAIFIRKDFVADLAAELIPTSPTNSARAFIDHHGDLATGTAFQHRRHPTLRGGLVQVSAKMLHKGWPDLPLGRERHWAGPAFETRALLVHVVRILEFNEL